MLSLKGIRVGAESNSGFNPRAATLYRLGRYFQPQFPDCKEGMMIRSPTSGGQAKDRASQYKESTQ
jgi:hypothetical protein